LLPFITPTLPLQWSSRRSCSKDTVLRLIHVTICMITRCTILTLPGHACWPSLGVKFRAEIRRLPAKVWLVRQLTWTIAQGIYNNKFLVVTERHAPIAGSPGPDLCRSSLSRRLRVAAKYKTSLNFSTLPSVTACTRLAPARIAKRNCSGTANLFARKGNGPGLHLSIEKQPHPAIAAVALCC
jgi:hypothetical protein